MLNIFGEEVSSGSYLGTMVQTINNPDGTVSIIQIDTGPNNVVTLSDGSQATVIHSVASVSYLKFIKFSTAFWFCFNIVKKTYVKAQ